MPSMRSKMMSTWFGGMILLVAVLFVPATAFAGVQLEGAWPNPDPNVSLEGKQIGRKQALEMLAEAAGWSVVVDGVNEDAIDLKIKEQPATKVLDMLLSDGSYVARREANRVTVAPATSAAPAVVPAVPAAPAAAPEPPSAASSAAVPEVPAVPDVPGVPEVAAPSSTDQDGDRTVMGGKVRVERGERVGDVTVMGGEVDIYGEVTGDLTLMGGKARVRKGAYVHGDATGFGGTMTLDNGSRVDGDVEMMGGSLRRDDGARVGGDLTNDSPVEKGNAIVSAQSHDRPTTFASLVDDAGNAITRTVLLFLFGAIFLALAGRQIEEVEIEIARRPMHSLALGVVGFLVGSLAALFLAVTVVGIPFAAAGLITMVVLGYVGVCAVLATVGQALLRHRTHNRYIHLGVGCALFLLATSIPWIGTMVWFAVALIGLGSIVASHGRSLIPGDRVERGPYRTAAA